MKKEVANTKAKTFLKELESNYTSKDKINKSLYSPYKNFEISRTHRDTILSADQLIDKSISTNWDELRKTLAIHKYSKDRIKNI